jgi:predicted deacylase
MKTVERLALLPSSPGTARHIAIHRYGGGSGPKVYVQASLHANELPAMLVAQHLIGLLDDAQAEGRITGDIVVVPVANPIGLGQGVDGVHLGRYELATGQNFNRGFFDHAVALAERVKGRLGTDAAGNVGLIRREWAALVAERTPSSELASLRQHLMSRALAADIVLDLHSADDALMHLYFGAARWPDGADLSAELGSVATLLAVDSGGEPFDEVFGNIWAKLRALLGNDSPIPDAIMSATVECRGHVDVSDELAAGDAQALLRFLMRRGVVAGDPGKLPALRRDAARRRRYPHRPGRRLSRLQGCARRKRARRRHHRRSGRPDGRGPEPTAHGDPHDDRRHPLSAQVAAPGPARPVLRQGRGNQAPAEPPGRPAGAVTAQFDDVARLALRGQDLVEMNAVAGE